MELVVHRNKTNTGSVNIRRTIVDRVRILRVTSWICMPLVRPTVTSLVDSWSSRHPLAYVNAPNSIVG